MKTFIIRSVFQTIELERIIKKLPCDGTIEVVIRKHKAKRNLEQNNLYWELLSQIAEQVTAEGKKYSKQAWHIYFATNAITSGMAEIESSPFNDVLVPISTSGLSKEAFSEYIDRVTAFAVTELGVKFEADQSRA